MRRRRAQCGALVILQLVSILPHIILSKFCASFSSSSSSSRLLLLLLLRIVVVVVVVLLLLLLLGVVVAGGNRAYCRIFVDP